jgi:chromate transporter
LSLTQGLPVLALTVPASFSLASLFLLFLKIGSVLYGSGYVLVAFLERDLVDRLGWLTQQQLLDVIAIGQITPGPVFTTATAIGYVMGGLPGAAVATIGIFLPSFLFVAMVNPLITHLRSNMVASAFLDGVNAGAVALMAGVAFTLGRAAIVDVPSGIVGMCAAYLLLRRGVSITWLIPLGAIIGVAYQWGAGAVTSGL